MGTVRRHCGPISIIHPGLRSEAALILGPSYSVRRGSGNCSGKVRLNPHPGAASAREGLILDLGNDWMLVGSKPAGGPATDWQEETILKLEALENHSEVVKKLGERVG